MPGKMEGSRNGLSLEGRVRMRRWIGYSRTRRGRRCNLSHCDNVEWTRRAEELEWVSWKTEWDCIKLRIAPNIRRMGEEKKKKKKKREKVGGCLFLASKTVVMRRGH